MPDDQQTTATQTADTTTQQTQAATQTSQASQTTQQQTTQAAATQTTSQATQAATQTQQVDQTKGYWPNDWVQRVSKGDDKVAKQLGRYASPEALAEAHLALRRRMDSGEFVGKLPKDPKPEELAAWRKDNGIPEKPDGYDLKFDSGLVVGKEDMPIIEGFRAAAHEANLTPAQFKNAVEWYYQDQERQTEARAARDEEERVTAVDALNQEWGANFRGNINRIEGVLALFPDGVRESLKAARMPDGTGLFNNVDVLRGFAALALELNPAGIVVPNDGTGIGKGLVEEWKGIQEVRSKDRAKYNKDDAMQARERVLIDAMIKQGLMDNAGRLIETGRKAA